MKYRIADLLTDEQKRRAVVATYHIAPWAQEEMANQIAVWGYVGPQFICDPRTAHGTCALGEAFAADLKGLSPPERYAHRAYGIPSPELVFEIIRRLDQAPGLSSATIREMVAEFVWDFDKGKLLGEALEEALGMKAGAPGYV